MKYRLYRVRMYIVSLVFILSACGGGGSGTNSSIENSLSSAINLSSSSSSPVSNSSSSLAGSSSSEAPVLTPPNLLSINTLNLIQDELLSLRLDNIGGKEIIECSSDLPESFIVTVSSDATTCEINGAAIALLELTSFTITATNADGSDSTPVPLEVIAATPFVTTWKTDNPGMSEDNQITIQTSPDFSYNYRVEWGDGLVDENVTGDITHSYAVPGLYQVSITGVFPQPFFKEERDSQKLLSVEHWGNRKWLSMNRAFFDCRHLIINDVLNPDLSRVTDMKSMFSNVDNIGGNISNWDVSNVTNMSNLFNGADNFNLDVSGWDVSQVTHFDAMFKSTQFNQNLAAWNISKAKSLASFAVNSDLSIENYDAILVSWSRLPLQQNVTFNAGSTLYTAESARFILTNNFGWSISDGGSLKQPDLQSTTVLLNTNNAASFTIENLGGTPDTCSADNLPEGLIVQPAGNSCEITGTAISPQVATATTVTATNLAGSNTFSITIRIDAAVPFVTTWKTDNPGISADNQITIHTSPGFSYNYRVDWGDGTVNENVKGDIVHSYVTPGAYSVAITGTFPQPLFPRTTNVSLSDSQKLLSIESWGNQQWRSMENAFFNCDNLVINDSQIPDLARVTNMNSMFADASNFNSNISHWNVSNVLNMADMFRAATVFNQDIGNWNVSKVTNMSGMFREARAFNQFIGNWDTSSLVNMVDMFRLATVFNQDIGNWNVSKVTNMSGLFREARAFNQSIGNWNVSNVINMGDMFFAANMFNADIGAWDVAKVTNMSRMFRGTQSFDQSLGTWNISNVTNMSDMFVAGVLTTTNYDSILMGWSQLPSVKTGVVLNAGSTKFSAAAQIARDRLINNFSWTITDGGLAP
jgi:surface protein